MGILYVDGDRLKRAVLAACQRVVEVQERINSINVFPVPDGDTGTNMALTLKFIAERAINAGSLPLASLSHELAESALLGARGNSGAVLAQFFQGMADSFAGHRRVTAQEFARSMEHSVSCARQAFVNPQEGTILSVMSAWSHSLRELSKESLSLRQLLRRSLAAASQALIDTPKRLKVLAKAGVVDAGGQGFVNMLEGVMDFVDTGELTLTLDEVSSSEDRVFAADPGESLTYQFCTECLVSGDQLNLNQVRESVAEMGDSLVVAGNTRTIRLHIHTNQPKTLFERAGSFGSVSMQKADDMWAQREARAHESKKVAVITDSSCDLPMDYLIRHGIRMVPVNVTFGSQTYIDRVNITSEEVYRMMVQEDRQPTTSQPTPAAFLKSYGLAAEHHEEAVAILVSAGVSGTFQSAITMAQSYADLNVEVVDSRTTAAGLGLLVRLAAEAAEAGCDAAEIRRRVEAARAHTRLFVAVDTLKYLVRGGRVSRMRGWIASLLNLVPILTFNLQGVAAAVAKTRPGRAARERIFREVTKLGAQLEKPRISVSHAAQPDQARELAKKLADHFALEEVPVMAVSPTIGAHVGPGAVAVAIQGFPPGNRPW